jgi:hypothetical protein
VTVQRDVAGSPRVSLGSFFSSPKIGGQGVKMLQGQSW